MTEKTIFFISNDIDGLKMEEMQRFNIKYYKIHEFLTNFSNLIENAMCTYNDFVRHDFE